MTVQTLKLNELDFKDHTPPKTKSSVHGILYIYYTIITKIRQSFFIIPLFILTTCYSYYINVTYIFTFHIDK